MQSSTHLRSKCLRDKDWFSSINSFEYCCFNHIIWSLMLLHSFGEIRFQSSIIWAPTLRQRLWGGIPQRLGGIQFFPFFSGIFLSPNCKSSCENSSALASQYRCTLMCTVKIYTNSRPLSRQLEGGFDFAYLSSPWHEM